MLFFENEVNLILQRQWTIIKLIQCVITEVVRGREPCFVRGCHGSDVNKMAVLADPT